METTINENASVEQVPSIQSPKGGKKKIFLASAIILVVLAAGVYGFLNRKPDFCFNFTPDMKFGDQPGQVSPNMFNGISYFIYEVTGLQGALIEEGYYVDPLEQDGGRVYLGAFFGPSTKVALTQFQKKHGLEQTGFVDKETSKELARLYTCPVIENAPVATSTVATSTVLKK